MRRAYFAYGVAVMLILVSWIGNIGYNSYYRMPEGRFLQHHIEATDTPSVAFDLLYVTNKGDKRTIQSIKAAELPTLEFYPVQVRQEMHRQTIYQFTGYYRSTPERKASLPPLNLHAVTVTYNDGTTREMEVGDIIVYRNEYPSSTSPVEFSSGGGSTDNTGFNTVRVTRQTLLNGTTSSWLSLLDAAFHYEVKWNGSNENSTNGSSELEAINPINLANGDSVTTRYQFKFADSNPLALDVFNLLLTHTFDEGESSQASYSIYANYLPYFTESQMKHFVRAQREALR